MSAESIEEYTQKKNTFFYEGNLRIEENFFYSLLPFTVEHAVLQAYPQWIEKRYTKKQMFEQAVGLKTESESKIVFLFILAYTGKMTTKGRTEVTIPDDFEEYVFLEQDKDTYVRCSKAEIPFMGQTINSFNDQTHATIVFPKTMPDSNVSITDGVDSLNLVIGGLDLKHDTFEIPIPLSAVYQDAPEEIKEIYYAAKIWPEH